MCLDCREVCIWCFNGRFHVSSGGLEGGATGPPKKKKKNWSLYCGFFFYLVLCQNICVQNKAQIAQESIKNKKTPRASTALKWAPWTLAIRNFALRARECMCTQFFCTPPKWNPGICPCVRFIFFVSHRPRECGGGGCCSTFWNIVGGAYSSINNTITMLEIW